MVNDGSMTEKATFRSDRIVNMLNECWLWKEVPWGSMILRRHVWASGKCVCVDVFPLLSVVAMSC